MFIIDGRNVRLKCRNCHTKFQTIVSTGPCYPSGHMIDSILRQNPHACPYCGSTNTYRCEGLRGALIELLE